MDELEWLSILPSVSPGGNPSLGFVGGRALALRNAPPIAQEKTTETCRRLWCLYLRRQSKAKDNRRLRFDNQEHLHAAFFSLVDPWRGVDLRPLRQRSSRAGTTRGRRAPARRGIPDSASRGPRGSRASRERAAAGIRTTRKRATRLRAARESSACPTASPAADLNADQKAGPDTRTAIPD